MIHSKTVTAIVPIKAHSERVPEKNFRPFADRPLFHHILQTLEETYAVDKVIVDTDSPRIMQEATELFGKVVCVERPEDLQGDFVSVNKIIGHDMDQVESDIYLQTHATNPLLKSATIGDALTAFAKSEQHDSLFSVNRFQTRLYFDDGRPVNHDPTELIRTQDLPPIYEENSCIYIFTRQSYQAADGRRIGNAPMMFETGKIESVDIDDEFTFRLAELLASFAHDRGPGR
ncbi:MAG: cytidylyltransferase domain-containing protein [Phycisphaerae bacterium]